jgi:hypothetical protein
LTGTSGQRKRRKKRMAASDDIAKILTSIGASGIATIITALTTLYIGNRNLRHQKAIHEDSKRMIEAKEIVVPQAKGRHRKDDDEIPSPEEGI